MRETLVDYLRFMRWTFLDFQFLRDIGWAWFEPQSGLNTFPRYHTLGFGDGFLVTQQYFSIVMLFVLAYQAISFCLRVWFRKLNLFIFKLFLICTLQLTISTVLTFHTENPPPFSAFGASLCFLGLIFTLSRPLIKVRWIFRKKGKEMSSHLRPGLDKNRYHRAIFPSLMVLRCFWIAFTLAFFTYDAIVPLPAFFIFYGIVARPFSSIAQNVNFILSESLLLILNIYLQVGIQRDTLHKKSVTDVFVALHTLFTIIVCLSTFVAMVTPVYGILIKKLA